MVVVAVGQWCNPFGMETEGVLERKNATVDKGVVIFTNENTKQMKNPPLPWQITQLLDYDECNQQTKPALM